MIFGHFDSAKSGFSPLAILRVLLSLAILVVLLAGILQAVKHFSGVDVVKMDPQTVLVGVLGSEQTGRVMGEVLDFQLPTSLDQLKSLINNPEEYFGGSGENRGNKGNEGGLFKANPNAKVVLRFALVADSHNHNQNLAKALNLAKAEGAKLVVGLGDYTEVGTLEELESAKSVFDLSGLPYYLTAGDHDLWNARDKGADSPDQHFIQVFGSSYQAFSDSSIRFILVYNSDNYQGVDELQMEWLQKQLTAYSLQPEAESRKPLAVFVFMHEPLYHPSSDHVMGKVTKSLSSQAEFLIQILKEAGVAGTFFGDTHFATSYQEPKTGLGMSIVGALTEERNTQKPRYSLVDVYDDGSYNVQDIEL